MWSSIVIALSLVLSPVAATKKRAKQKQKRKAPVTAPMVEPQQPEAAPVVEVTPSAIELLRKADRARGGLKDGITWQVELEAVEDGEKTVESYLVKSRENDNIAEVTAPPRRKGELMLFNDRTIWFYKPGLRKPVSISARQKLTGDAVNGDIATTRYARDYEGKVVGKETIDGVPMWKLELTGRGENVTYDRIRYWISADRNLGMRAEFLSLSGELIKAARFAYDNTITIDGKSEAFVSVMTITDPNIPGNVTVLKFSPPRPETHPATIFNVNNLIR